MPTLYIMCGLAFSGKSTLSRKISEHTRAKIIAFDKLWAERDKEQPVPKGDEGWKFIRKAGQDEVYEALKEGSSVVYDDNNPRFEHREELRKVAKNAGTEAMVIYLNTPIETIREREATNRSTGERHEVEPKNFEKVAADLEVPKPEENFLEFTPATDIKEFLQKLT